MDDRETELSRFRQQWTEEVTARTRGPSAPQPSGPSAPRPKAGFAARKLSHSSAAPAGIPEEGEDEGESTAPLPERERPTSPAAVRRTSVSVPPVVESALEHYEKAVEKEAQGSLGESLSLYRKAYRMDAKVDSQYRDKYFPRPPAGTSAPAPASKPKDTPTPTPTPQTAPSAPAPPPTTLASGSKAISLLIASFAHLHIPPALPPQLEDSPDTEPPEPPFSPLTTLPSELLLHILRDLALADIASFSRCAQVCKALAFIVITEQSIWRDVCAATYKRMHWDWSCQVNGAELIHRPLAPPEDPSTEAAAAAAAEAEAETEAEENDDEKRTIPHDEALLPAYANSWRKMHHSRPRIRFNGVYISTCNYVRSGASQSGWNTPVHIVTYYRYLRFHADGTVLSLLTTTEPAEVVNGLNRASLTPAHLREREVAGGAGVGVGVGAWGKYVNRGRWRMDPEGRVDVETEACSMERYLFRMQFRVRGAGRRGGGCRLVWEGFWSWNRLTDDLAEFSLRNDKAFFFSRVGSIERELGIL